MRIIKFYRTETSNCPVEDFLKNLSDKQAKKVAWTLRVVRELEQVPSQYLKKLKSTDDIWEVRVIFGNKDRKSTRLNSSHVAISYAVFCLKKKTSRGVTWS